MSHPLYYEKNSTKRKKGKQAVLSASIRKPITSSIYFQFVICIRNHVSKVF